MAARLVQSISDDYLSCSICRIRFNDPRRLPCDHTFCCECIQKHIDNSVCENSDIFYFKCPLCRSEVSKPKRSVNVRKWAKDFIVDELIRDLVVTLSQHERQLQPQQNLQEQNLHYKCKVHVKNDLNIYCLHHYILMCTKCAEAEHKSHPCECLSVEGAFIKLTPKVAELRKQLHTQVLKLEGISAVDTEFNKQKEEAVRQVNHLEDRLARFHERCNQQLVIQKRDLENLNRDHIEERRIFYVLAAQLLETQSRVESLCESSDKIGVLRELSDVTKTVEANNQTLSKLSIKAPTGKVQFIINSDLNKFLDSFSAVGFVDKTSSKSVLDDFKTELQHPDLPTSLKSILSRSRSVQAMGQNIGKITPKSKFSGKLASEDSCWLIKIVVLPDSNICVLDKENTRLKRYTNQGQLVTSLNLVDVPYGMDLLKPRNEIVITKADREILEFISTEPNQLSVRKVIPTAKKYFGVCHISGDMMAVSSWSQSCVDIIDGNGWILSSVREDPLTHRMLFEIPDMLCCNGKSEIVVIDKGNKLTCMEKNGKIKWSISNKHVMNNISFSEDDQIYICCKDAMKICVLNTLNGQQSSISEIDIEGRKPLDICVWNSQMLMVLENGEIEIFVKG